MGISYQQDERRPTCGEDNGEVALGDKKREVKEATQALSTSGHTFSREQLDKSNQVREGEEVMSSKWQFSNSNWLNCAFETLENLKTFDESATIHNTNLPEFDSEVTFVFEREVSIPPASSH